MTNEIRTDRFTWNAGDMEIQLSAEVLQEELEKNLSAMENKNLSNETFVQLSERNIEIQKMLLK